MITLISLGILALLIALFFVGCAIVNGLNKVERQLRWQNEHSYKQAAVQTPPPLPR